ncbi:MAG: hypothetical protein LBE36_14280 [Flavobacteriaceae bacterium]|nr:hypothetical protein [Flavobacteriaceae bacterium]
MLRRKSGKSVFFDIKTMGAHRRSYQIIQQFLYCGYTCYIRFPYNYYREMEHYGKKIIHLKKVYFSNKKNKFSITVSGSEDFLNQQNCDKKILFSIKLFQILPDITDKDFFAPPLLHPNLFFPETEKKIYSEAFANISQSRPVAAIFVGNVNNVLSNDRTDNTTYNLDATKKDFNIYTRVELFKYIYEELFENVYLPASYEELTQKIKTGELKNKIVLIDTKVCKIPQKYLLKTLLQTNFFIYMPGFWQPYCHNHIESMLAGCIPVTQFNRFYLNYFQHQHNALLFNEIHELKPLLQNIIAGKYEENLAEMRKNILELYLQKFSFEAFRIKLSEALASKSHTLNYYTPPTVNMNK